MKIARKSLCLLFCFALLLGCSSKKKGGYGDGAEGDGLSESDLALQRYGEGNIPRAEAGGALEDIYFDYDSAAVSPEGRSILEQNASIIKSTPGARAEIEGHCDKRGTSEYNLALGEERARAVASTLVSLGVPSTQLSIISYGEEIPLDPRESEDAYAKNRRAHFVLSSSKNPR